MYTFNELNAQKEEAIRDRKEWKDLYDLYWMKRLYPQDFMIRDKKTFLEAIDQLQVPKTANAYIPSTKRLNWEEVMEDMKQYAKE